MADLSLKTTETLGKPEKIEETKHEVSAQEKNPAETEKSLVQVNKQEETLEADKAISEEGSKHNDNDQEIGDTEIYIDLGDILVSEHANTETNNDNEEFKNAQALDSFVQVEHLGTEESIQENDSETEKINTFDEEDTMVDQSEGDSEVGSEEDNSSVDSDDTISEADSNQADNQETEQTVQKNDPETEKINTFP
ncbi:unnamed protein product [Brassica rapa subsp. narinosa]